MIVVDASVLIGHLDAGDAHHDRATGLLEGAAGEQLAASSVTLAEALVAPARAGRLDDAWTAIQDLGVAELPFGEDAARRLAHLRADTGLRMPDCCVLLATRDTQASLASFDERLRAAARSLRLELAAG